MISAECLAVPSPSRRTSHRFRTPRIQLRIAFCAGCLLLATLLGVTHAADNAASQETAASREIAASHDIVIEQAIEQYSQGLAATDRSEQLQKFRRADVLFRQAIEANEDNGIQSPPKLWIAHGNAALQAEDIGSAIYAFRRSLLLDPSDQQAAQNLEYARSLVPAWIRFEDSSSLSATLFFWHAFLSRPAEACLAAACFLAAGLFLAASMLMRWTLLRYMAALPLIVWCILLIGLWSGQGGSTSRGAVVVADECTLRTADSVTAPPRLSQPLPSGAELRIISSRGKWIEVDVGGRSGWLLASKLKTFPE